MPLRDSSTGPTLLLEAGRLLQSRRLKAWDQPGARWRVFRGGLFTQKSERHGRRRFGLRSLPTQATIRWLDFIEYFDEMVDAGTEALDHLDGHESALRDTAVGIFLRKRLGSDRVFDALKKDMALIVRDRIFFYRLARRLSKEVEDLVVVRNGPDILGLDEKYGLRLNVIYVDRWGWRTRARSLLAIVFKLGEFLYRRGVTLAKPRSAPIDFATPLVVGFEPQKERHCHSHMDNYLWDESRFKPERFLFVRHVWFRQPTESALLNREVQFLRKHGASYADVAALPLSPTTLLRLLKDIVRFSAYLLRDLCLRRIDPAMIHAARRILFAMFREEVFLEHWAPKVYLSRDDYDPAHAVRTMVFNQRGLKTIGIHHSTYLPQGLFPSMAYVFYNTFCVYGLGFARKYWSPRWMLSERVAEVGMDRNDETWRLMRMPAVRAELHERYPYRMILAWFPPGLTEDMGMSEERIRGIAQGFRKVSENHPDLGIIIKPRPAFFPFYESLATEGMVGKHAHVLARDISTPCLLAASDIVVSTTISSILPQAVCLGIERVVAVDYWNWESHPFRAYSPSLVVSDASQLVERLEALIAGAGIDRDGLSALRGDFDPISDDQAINRFKAEVLRLVGCDGGTALLATRSLS